MLHHEFNVELPLCLNSFRVCLLKLRAADSQIIDAEGIVDISD